MRLSVRLQGTQSRRQQAERAVTEVKRSPLEPSPACSSGKALVAGSCGEALAPSGLPLCVWLFSVPTMFPRFIKFSWFSQIAAHHRWGPRSGLPQATRPEN